ncbi:MAG: type II secretion system protein [Phycisphaerae bacterium]|nr:type II secretion system protein [Phycisphaerae bacterium]
MTTERLGLSARGAAGAGLSARRSGRGFTLTELLIVITAVGVLIGLLLPALGSALFTARVTQVRSDLQQVGTALHQYYLAHDALPPARKYCLSEKRDLFLALPRELVEGGYLDALPPDAFDEAHTYRYTAVGPGFVNDSPCTIKFVLPEAFPQSGGEWVKYAQPDDCPVKCVIWSVGPNGPPPFEVLLGFNPLAPANWYPANPNGILCRYYTGKNWRYSY